MFRKQGGGGESYAVTWPLPSKVVGPYQKGRTEQKHLVIFLSVQAQLAFLLAVHSLGAAFPGERARSMHELGFLLGALSPPPPPRPSSVWGADALRRGHSTHSRSSQAAWNHTSLSFHLLNATYGKAQAPNLDGVSVLGGTGGPVPRAEPDAVLPVVIMARNLQRKTS